MSLARLEEPSQPRQVATIDAGASEATALRQSENKESRKTRERQGGEHELSTCWRRCVPRRGPCWPPSSFAHGSVALPPSRRYVKASAEYKQSADAVASAIQTLQESAAAHLGHAGLEAGGSQHKQESHGWLTRASDTF